MKRLALAGLAGVCFALLSAVPALAGSELPQPHKVLGRVVRPPGAASGSLAFTGAGGTIRLWMVLAATLLIVGATLLIATRRRRAADTE
jgi:hypothetical protein